MASVDVVVPCYNYARYLRACVESVLSQENVDVRITIIDDHSPDNTPEVGRALAEADSRVTYVRHEVNKGHIATYNEGLERATADHVVVLSADDLLTPGALGRATALMDANPSVGLVYGRALGLYGDVLPPARTKSTGTTVWKGADWVRLKCKAGRNFICSPEVVMRTKIQRQLGGYEPSLPHSADMEMWMRAALISDVGRVNGAEQAYYRVHKLSMMRTTFAGAIPDLVGRRDAYISALVQSGLLPRGSKTLIDTAMRAVALQAISCASRTARSTSPDAEMIERCRDFAAATWPEIVRARQWRALSRSVTPGPGLRETVMRMALSKLENLQDHLAWRKWHRTGVF